MGDKDECSYKHILHGLTALYWLGSWEKLVDYTTPGYSTREQIEPYWDMITKIFKQVGKDEFKKLVNKCDNGSYSCDYRMDLYNQSRLW